MVKTNIASVYKRVGKKDTTYYIRFRQNDEVITEKVGKASDGMTAEKAYEILLQRKEYDQRKFVVQRQQRRETKFESLESLSIRYFEILREKAEADSFLPVEERQSKSLKNIAKEESLYKSFWKDWKLRRMSLLKIKEEHVADYLMKKREKMSHKTVYNGLTLAKSILKHTKYQLHNPFLFSNDELQKRFKQKTNARKRFLNEIEIKLLLKAAKEELSYQNYLLVLTALMTGARPNSVINLKRKNINYEKNEITFYDFKRKMHYTVPLPKQLVQKFKDHEVKNYTYLFYSDKSQGKKPISQFPRAIQRLLDKLFNLNLEDEDERVVVYTLRHTFANHLLQVKKLPIQDVSHLLNHASVETTTKNYIHMINENIRNSDLSDLFD